MIAKGEPWGRPVTGPPDVVVDGGDDALAGAVAAHPGTRFQFDAAPDSDFARAVGLAGVGERTTEVECDALDVDVDGVRVPAVNMVVVGTAPDRQRWWSRSTPVHVAVDGRVVHDGRAAAVVVANGQHLRGNDVVPRGHPGDGRVEVQVYALARGERRPMRARLRDGTHVPHPRIRAASGRRVEIRGGAEVEIDGIRAGAGRAMTVVVAPAAFTLLV